MGKMESLKQKGAKLRLFDKDWELTFTTNVIDEIQDHFDINMNEVGISPLSDRDDKSFFSNVAYIAMLLINEQIEMQNEELTEKIPLYTISAVKRRVCTHNWTQCYIAISSAYSAAWLKPDEDEPKTP